MKFNSTFLLLVALIISNIAHSMENNMEKGPMNDAWFYDEGNPYSSANMRLKKKDWRAATMKYKELLEDGVGTEHEQTKARVNLSSAQMALLCNTGSQHSLTQKRLSHSMFGGENGNIEIKTNNVDIEDIVQFLDAIKKLKAKGIDITLTTDAIEQKRLDEKLTHAIFWGKDEEIETLLQQGANPNNHEMGTHPLHTHPLHSVVEDPKRQDVLRLLLKYGADPNGKDCNYEHNPLHRADISNVELLLKKGADPNDYNKWGNAPLHTAKTGEKAQLLLQYGANPNIYNIDGDTPLKVAMRLERHEVVKVLQDWAAATSAMLAK